MMAKKRSRSRGIRPVRQAWLSGLVMVASFMLVIKGVTDMRATGQSASPYLMLGMFPIGFVYYVSKIPVVRAMRQGTSAIARWTVSADEFGRFCEEDARVESETRNSNFYKPPGTIPATGVEVIFSDDAVLIGDGYFPLSTTRGRRVRRRMDRPPPPPARPPCGRPSGSLGQLRPRRPAPRRVTHAPPPQVGLRSNISITSQQNEGARMPKARLDHGFVQLAYCEPGRSKTDYYDETVTGFVLEVRSSGGKTYYLRYADASGRQRQYKIGKVDDVTFAAAKKKAQQLRSEVVMGGDPGAAKAEAKATPLFRELAALHMADAKLHLKSYPTMEASYRVHILPKWGKVRVTEITPRGVSQWLAEKRAAGSSPATVEKMRVILGRSYVLGQRWEIPGTDKNPARGIVRKPLNNARERFLTAEEAERLREAAAMSANTQLLNIVRLLLLTGARVRELLEARVENVNVERRTWLIPTSKTGKPRHVPLSTAALAIITGLPRFKDCPWLIPNPDTLKPFISIKHSWKTAIKVAKLPGLRIHDLRHSAASFLVAAGIDLYAVGKILGHANVASSARYAHLANDQLVAAVEAAAAKQVA